MPIFFRDFDHQLIQPILVASVKENFDKYDYSTSPPSFQGSELA
jgi:hypothetical protein